jgi:hypothetical protein
MPRYLPTWAIEMSVVNVDQLGRTRSPTPLEACLDLCKADITSSQRRRQAVLGRAIPLSYETRHIGCMRLHVPLQPYHHNKLPSPSPWDGLVNPIAS